MDPTQFNYNPQANLADGSCIPFVYGCMDTTAYNYDPLVNLPDNDTCLYDAGCIGDPGDPYWLNDPCYAWVLSVDDYCCENAWDTICQATYDYCEGTWTGPRLMRETTKTLIKVTDLLGRPIKEIKNTSIKIAMDSVKKIISTSVDKNKLDAIFEKDLEEAKTELKKINS